MAEQDMFCYRNSSVTINNSILQSKHYYLNQWAINLDRGQISDRLLEENLFIVHKYYSTESWGLALH